MLHCAALRSACQARVWRRAEPRMRIGATADASLRCAAFSMSNSNERMRTADASLRCAAFSMTTVVEWRSALGSTGTDPGSSQDCVGIHFASACCFSRAAVALGLMRLRRPSALRSAPRLISSMVCSGVSAGSRAINFAARFTTLGEAIEVPENFILVPPGTIALHLVSVGIDDHRVSIAGEGSFFAGLVNRTHGDEVGQVERGGHHPQ